MTGVANSFEASGPCRLLQDGKEIALEGYQSEGWMGNRLFPFEVELPARRRHAARSCVQCETDDPSGGAEGNGPAVDTKTITRRGSRRRRAVRPSGGAGQHARRRDDPGGGGAQHLGTEAYDVGAGVGSAPPARRD